MTIQAINHARYIRRRVVSAFMTVLCSVAAVIGLIFLGLILWTLVEKGAAGLSPNLFTHSMKTPGQGGGLGNAIVGSLIQVGMGTLLGAPLGMAVGVYLAEVGREGRFASVVRFVNDILLSAPSVLVGLFVYQIVVVPMGGFSAIAGSIALALLAMPVIARTTEDIMKLVPEAYREGSKALGARDSTTVLKVTLPAAFGGILTGVLLAVARISGETAPLIFTSLGSFNWSENLTSAMASLPIAIYRYASSPYEEWVDLAWSGALIITLGVLVLNIASRISHFLVSGRQ
ncbi:MAG: phosphate ABC transporter permease PstA [Hyphomonadaceae bacterium]|nr:MAG: phosphate transport system permease protein [Caulobacteraceae bacterium]MBT9445712.1 phosphate ABC transporter permease PstA [Hyphomonadaceae bacterium]TPW08745.1 MAG: phosphate transport system permease protein [Alphaproteobacteria bacterium]